MLLSERDEVALYSDKLKAKDELSLAEIRDAAAELGVAPGVTLKLFATNLTDKIYRTYSFASGPTVFSNIGEGRMVGASLRSRF